MRYKPILMARVEEEKRQLKESMLLSEEAGVIQSTDDIVVKKKNFKDYVRDVTNIAISAVYLTLIFLGLLVLLNPTSRDILLKIASF